MDLKSYYHYANKLIKKIPKKDKKIEHIAVKEAKSREKAFKHKKKILKDIKKYIKKNEYGNAIEYSRTALYGAVAEEHKICISFIKGPEAYEKYYYKWLAAAKGGIKWEKHYNSLAKEADRLIPGINKEIKYWKNELHKLLKIIESQLLYVKKISAVKVSSQREIQEFLKLIDIFEKEVLLEDKLMKKAKHKSMKSIKLIHKASRILKKAKIKEKKFKGEHPLAYLGITTACTVLASQCVFIVGGHFLEMSLGHEILEMIHISEWIGESAHALHGMHHLHLFQ